MSTHSQHPPDQSDLPAAGGAGRGPAGLTDGDVAAAFDDTDTSSIASGQEDRATADADDFIALAAHPASVTARGAARFGVGVDQFCSWRWQMSHQAEHGSQTRLALSASESEGFRTTRAMFESGITPYYLSLMNPDPSASCPVRLQGLPRAEELRDKLGLLDPLSEVPHSPVPEVVQVYPDRVAFCVAQLCPVYCRYCFRKRRDGEAGLHFNRRIIDRGIAYIASNPAIRDVLVTGGDPFIASDAALENLTARLRAIPHVEIIRFGTRTPVTLPYRVTKKLCRILARFHPVFVNTHFNCGEELTPEAALATANLADAGIPVGNQSVLLRGVNDSRDRMLPLLRGLLRMRVRPYYLFYPHLVAGTAHLRVSVADGVALMKSLRGQITGLGLPTFIVDTPAGKVPLMPDPVLGRDGEDLIMEDPRGQIWRERGAFSPPATGGD